MAMKTCPKCGRAGSKTAVCCSNCGEHLVMKSEYITEPVLPDKLDAKSLDDIEQELAALPAPGPDLEPDTSLEEASVAAPADLLSPDESEKTFALEVKNGLSTGANVTLMSGRAVLIGASSDADLVLKDSYASRKHASVTMRNGKLFLTDEGSTNGTFLQVRGARELRPGDLVIIGNTMIEVVEQ